MQQRVVGFDALRGLCALGVALYHLCYWSGGPILHTIGIYGVHVFFVLSGASLYLAYHQISTQADLLRFAAARVARIAPLFMAVTLYAAFVQFPNTTPDRLWLNLTMMFSFANPGLTSVPTGGWSLGIETCFYAAFPIACALARTRAWWLVAVALFAAQQLYVNAVVGIRLDTAWGQYVQPISFAGYFFIGLAIGRTVVERWLAPHRGWWYASLLLATLIVVWPAGNPADILKREQGVLLTLAACALALSVAFAPFRGRFVVAGAGLMGNLSYSLYLLHPIIYDLGAQFLPAEVHGPAVMISATLGASLVASWLSFHYFEEPIRRLPRRLWPHRTATAADRAAQ